MSGDASAFDLDAFFNRCAGWLGQSTEAHACVSSTMDIAEDAFHRGAPHGHVVVADAQTAARGSRGKEWLGDGQLTFSFLLRVDLPLAACPPLTLAAGLGVSDFINEALGADDASRIKWPNDVLVGADKVAGILSESRGHGGIVVGIGLNVVHDEALEAVGGTSLATLGTHFSREDALARLLPCLASRIEDHLRLGAAHTSGALQRRLAWREERVRCGDVSGILEGVAPDGRLMIRENGSLRSVSAGTLRRE